MKEKAIKIKTFSLGVSGFAFLAILFSLFHLPFTANITSILSYILLFAVGIVELYSAFEDNENPFQAMRHSFNYILDKVRK